MTYLSEVLADAPVDYWRCADPGGAYLMDIGSAPDHLIFNTAAEVYTPYVGPVSNGGSASVGLGYFWDNQGTTLAQPITVEMFVWMHSVQTYFQVAFLAISGAGTLLQVGITTGGLVQINGPTGNISYATPLTRQAWHHVWVTCDAVGASELRIDAILRASGNIGTTTSGVKAIAIGGLNGVSDNRFIGNVAEVAIYGSVLSAARNTAHFIEADATSSRPVFRASGGPGGSPGITLLASDQVDEILQSVRKTY